MFASVFEALLQHHDRLRVATQHVQSSCPVVVEVQSHLELLSFVLNLQQDVLTHLQALLGHAALEVEVGEVLSSR